MRIIILAVLICACQAAQDPTLCSAPHVPNGQPEEQLKDLYNDGEYVTIVCDRGYEIENRYRYAMCVRGTWRLPVCEAQARTLCSAPQVPNARPEVQLKPLYKNGEYIRFVCNRGYELEHRDPYAQCAHGTWRLPVCKAQAATLCTAPRVPNAQPAETLSTYYPSGRTVTFKCNSDYVFEGTDTAQCISGIWRVPVCKRQLGG